MKILVIEILITVLMATLISQTSFADSARSYGRKDSVEQVGSMTRSDYIKNIKRPTLPEQLQSVRYCEVDVETLELVSQGSNEAWEDNFLCKNEIILALKKHPAKDVAKYLRHNIEGDNPLDAGLIRLANLIKSNIGFSEAPDIDWEDLEQFLTHLDSIDFE